ncbi:MAG: hypothetical protein DMF58_04975 [Acidobacteria bacterium]|nr:MAG: hypothetical protein DMF58_04975 [Acidobacteriota bacterium]
MSSHYRTIAGNLELFIGAYLIDFGLLGLLFFGRHFHDRNGAYASAAGAVIGLLLLTRSRRLLDWHGAIFWSIVFLAVVVPVAILLPPLLRLR